ncbi:hypothetical protein CWI36_0323p0010 [Hamiltosporidium magnivora]|uniref:Uncharacterized protein n=1 Tax=Hamiltosporidium magnivora TaxID=148818 RepID=A0A4Q9LGC2_9MICR|nr:hypothetical protein CWI36_0323p0010 [Hamiltosporidium magnivora]
MIWENKDRTQAVYNTYFGIKKTSNLEFGQETNENYTYECSYVYHINDSKYEYWLKLI